MTISVHGVVTNGVVIPDSPLPEGASVQIHLNVANSAVPSDLQEEFDDWDRASAIALELVERLADEMERDDKR